MQEIVEDLGLDLQALAEEHNRYCMDASTTEDQAIQWLHSLPIETLSDSINKERQRPRNKYSLHDIIHKSNLRKLHAKKKDELDIIKTKLNIAKIDDILKMIKDLEVL